jgi:hypothetical protein
MINRHSPMQIVELNAAGLVTAVDFVNVLKKLLGAPAWHGASVDAFLDSMIYHDDINTLKSPYTIRITGARNARSAAQDFIRLLAREINTRGASDRGDDLEITILVEDSCSGTSGS